MSKGAGMRVRRAATGGSGRRAAPFARGVTRRIIGALAVGALGGAVLAGPAAAQFMKPSAPAADPLAAKNRLFVLTDVGNEPDDQMSLVRLVLYSNELDIEGLAAVTSEFLRAKTHPETIEQIVDAYGQVRPNLLQHADGWPKAQALRQVISSGKTAYGLAGIDPAAPSAAAKALISAADRQDARPLWVSIWGGAATLAEALQVVRASRSPEAVDAFVAKLRVYSISDQDDAGPWIRREFPKLFYVVSPGGGEDFAFATWTGISGDAFYGNDQGAADATKISEAWLDANIRKGPLGVLYPKVPYIMEGDTPAWLGLAANGLNSALSPAWGGWGGRYVHRRPYGEARSIWTQGWMPVYGAGSRDEVVGVDGRKVRSDQATIWRWRDAYQNAFAARIAWTTRPRAEANHPPEAVVNGDRSSAPIYLELRPGELAKLDAGQSRDPDRGQRLRYKWFNYREAGASTGPLTDVAITGADRPQATLQAPLACRPVFASMKAPCPTAVGHVILEVSDDRAPSLTTYRRVIVRVTYSPKK